MKSKAYDQGKKAEFNNDDHDGSRTVAAAEEALEKATKADSTRRTISQKFFRLIPIFLKDGNKNVRSLEHMTMFQERLQQLVKQPKRQQKQIAAEEQFCQK